MTEERATLFPFRPDLDSVIARRKPEWPAWRVYRFVNYLRWRAYRA